MDNSPRNPYPAKGGCAVDTSSQMVMFAEDLSVFAAMCGKRDEADQFKRDAEDLARRINQHVGPGQEVLLRPDLGRPAAPR